MDKFILYSVEGADGTPRQMFSDTEEAERKRLPHEYVVEYTFALQEKEPVVYPSHLTLAPEEE
tara:strand:+ start:129 stop:317 length:189 start_codon:yes stop_codon:yes gene_type:complete